MSFEIFHSLSPEPQIEFLDGPALNPPDGESFQFEDPPNSDNIAWGILTTCIVLVSLTSIMHVFCRTFVVKKFYLEDSEWLYG
jgi:hypothetical protein